MLLEAFFRQIAAILTNTAYFSIMQSASTSRNNFKLVNFYQRRIDIASTTGTFFMKCCPHPVQSMAFLMACNLNILHFSALCDETVQKNE
jgi:hypothetical protein